MPWGECESLNITAFKMVHVVATWPMQLLHVDDGFKRAESGELRRSRPDISPCITASNGRSDIQLQGLKFQNQVAARVTPLR